MIRIFLLFLSLQLTGCATLLADIGIWGYCRGVIGISYDRRNKNRVDYTMTGSPGEKLGIVNGDYLINPDDLNEKPGTTVKVIWEHKGIRHEVFTQTACLNDLYDIEYKERQKNYPGWDVPRPK